jgi:formylglycine-generating enzyme required for sulfatase activity
MKYITVLLMLCFAAAIHAQTEPEATAEPQAGAERVDASGVEQVYVPAGCFLMGSTEDHVNDIRSQSPPPWVIRELPSELPQHEVCLTSGYWIDKYEVTNASFQNFVDDGGYTTQEYWSEDGWEWLSDQNIDDLPDSCVDVVDDHPRVCVTWYEAEAYANWRGGSLPTDAQWEYAARGPEALLYPWGNEWDEILANVVDSEELTPVGSYPDGVSWVGAFDMSGNAMEWVQDWLDADYYEESPREDPTGPETGRVKSERGGWWGSNPFVARTTYRHYEDPPTYQDHHIGFRVVSAGE